MGETAGLRTELEIMMEKAKKYGELNLEFQIVCNKDINEVLKHITKFGLNNTEITEQQALNRLAERFPMTTDQIVSTLEMKAAHVEQEKVEVPELVAKYLDYARQCLDLNVLTICNYQNVKSNMETLAADEIVHWAHKHPDDFMRAYQTGNYTVKKEPTVHNLKIGLTYFKAVRDGRKTFEIRKNDRDYKVGDILVLQEYTCGSYTDEQRKVKVTYMTDYEQKDDYVVLGIVPVEEEVE